MFWAGAPPPGMQGWKLRVAVGEGRLEQRLMSYAAVSTSGDAHQFAEIGGVAYSHVLDPATGLGVTEGRQVSVQAPAAALADALSTAACVMSEEAFRALAGKIPGVSVLGFFRIRRRRMNGAVPSPGRKFRERSAADMTFY